MTDQYDNNGQVAFWKSRSENPKAPALVGSIYIPEGAVPGQKMRIALWKNVSENERAPVLKGRCEAEQEQSAPAPQAPAPQAGFEDIPF